ncbi:helix-turn-helix domain-containing protein [Pseudonocardia sp. RS010]|uniref:helix-turn-helix domain-containing protein n=1 Tax=Pseudonocardia sp. RS010 TaxID=3385979 RepID=UPI0039A0D8B0
MSEPTAHRHEDDDMLSLSEAARVLGVAANTLRNWADAEKVTAVRTPGGHRRFRYRDVRQLLAASS